MRYRTIVVDPPWRYDANIAPAKNFELQYPSMSTEDIWALPVQDYADDNAHLYLWVTNLKLHEARAIELVEQWGFRFVTLLTWHKLGSPGMGWYFRGDTEHVIFAVRGSLPIAPAIRESNHFAAAKGRHSAKPDRFYELVERVSPGPYLELFARRRRHGWDEWGNEAPEFAASQAEMGLVDPLVAPIMLLDPDVLRWVFALYQAPDAFGPRVVILGTPGEAADILAAKYAEYVAKYRATPVPARRHDPRPRLTPEDVYVLRRDPDNREAHEEPRAPQPDLPTLDAFAQHVREAVIAERATRGANPESQDSMRFIASFLLAALRAPGGSPSSRNLQPPNRSGPSD